MPKLNVIAFLDPEPPQDPKGLRRLFVDRDRELAQTVNRLKAIRQHDPLRVLAVTGLARVGKSHLLSRAILEARRSFQAVVSTKISPGHSGGPSVLRVDPLVRSLILEVDP